jgi:hypothetical protein
VDLKNNIQQMDVSLDDAHAELDQKTEELAAMKNHESRQCVEFSNIQHAMSVTASKEDNMQRQLFDRENEIRTLKTELHIIS